MGGENGDKRTERMVLRRERVIVLPDGAQLTAEQQKGIAQLLGVKTNALPVAEAWMPVGPQEGSSMRAAIEAYAGKPGPKAIPGDYKAPTLTAWRGGESYVKPPEPKVERAPLED